MGKRLEIPAFFLVAPVRRENWPALNDVALTDNTDDDPVL
jgi:hypothetical protein